jgi:hypothetical protein
LDIAEPDVSSVKPKWPFYELEAISQFFQLRRGRYKGIEGRIEPDQIAMNLGLCGLRDWLLGLFSAAEEHEKGRDHDGRRRSAHPVVVLLV